MQYTPLRRTANCRLLDRTVCSGTGHDIVRGYLTWSSLPEEHIMLRDMCRNFADNELAPHAGEWDRNHTFPKDQVSPVERREDGARGALIVGHHYHDALLQLLPM